jgi:type I restriction-modification system DNA methylase subunit
MPDPAPQAKVGDDAKFQVQLLLSKLQRIRAELSARGATYTEEETKKDLILPLFRALGWDVNNDRSYEVTAEEAVSRGRVDYGFRIDGRTKFFVEAKPLGENLEDPDRLRQTIGYGYGKSVTWTVLTNFERTLILNSDVKEANPARSVFIDLPAADYLNRFDQLWLLSKPACVDSKLDREAERWGRITRRQPVGKQLLEDLMTFRLELSKDILRLNHSSFDAVSGSLDETVQRLLNRLIFIRVTEDREMEEPALRPLERDRRPGLLLRGLRQIFREFDRNYDTRLFAPHAVDEVKVDEEVLRSVIRGLYETHDGSVTYDFAAIDADVLGVMYEQYLGLILRRTPKRTALKGGVAHRKEQGIFYTPVRVVDYIVRESIAVAIQRRNGRPENVRIVDPACGSGSFLLRAYDVMRELRRPTEGKGTQAKFDQELGGELFATRVAILKENLFGVDLDPQAVEIAQLNLMIRAAESRHRLPTLENNVRVGNSIVSDRSVDGAAFDWLHGFPDAFAAGGFDVVVGNPPWVQSKFIQSEFKEYYGKNYENARRQYDLFTLFVERGFALLNVGGVLGFILPDRFLANPDYRVFRQWLLDKSQIRRIVPMGEGIFEGVEMPSCIVIIQKPKAARPRNTELVEIADGLDSEPRTVKQSRLASGGDLVFSAVFSDVNTTALTSSVEVGSTPLGELVTNARGVEIGKAHPAISSTSGDVPFLIGADIGRYEIRGRHWLKLGHPGISPKDYKPPDIYRGEKILIRKTGSGINAVLDRDDYAIQVIYIFKPRSPATDLRAILGILNSKLMAFYYFSKFGQRDRGVFPHLTQNKVLGLPIRVDPARWRRISDLVGSMLSAMEVPNSVGELRLDRVNEARRRARRIDAEIDEEVFSLYGIGNEEQRYILKSLSSASQDESSDRAE